MNVRSFILTAGVLVGLLLVSWISHFIYGKFRYRTDVTLARDFLVTEQWQEIDVKGILPPLSKDRNDLYVAVSAPFETFNIDRGIKTPDGIIVEPEIQVVDSDGIIHLLKQTGAARGYYEKATFGSHPELAKETQVVCVRIRANHSIRVSAIIWSSYDIRDLP